MYIILKNEGLGSEDEVFFNSKEDLIDYIHNYKKYSDKEFEIYKLVELTQEEVLS